MSRRRGFWQLLGIDSTYDAREIRRAYAAKLKLTHPEDDPEGFKQLRAAYEAALKHSVSAPQEVIESSPVTESPAMIELPAGIDLSAPASKQESGDFADTTDETSREEIVPAFSRLDITPVHAPPPAELDRDLLAQQAAIAAISEALHHGRPVDETRVQVLLQAALDAGRLERFDLYQKTETELGELLANTIPRSDPFLTAVEQKFEWAKRQNDRYLPRFARTILGRLSDLWYLAYLQRHQGEESRALRRLSLPAKPGERWFQAHTNLGGACPELELIAKLENEHPRLLAELRAENVAWWRRFASRPHFSANTMLFGLLASLVAVLILFEAPARGMALILVPFAGFAFAAFRLYAVDWPIHLVRERWRHWPPHWFNLGWLPVCITLSFGAVIASDSQRFGWTIAALAWIAAWWAVIAGGPAAPVVAKGALRPANSRLISSISYNFIALIWLTVAVGDVPSGFPWPLRATVLGALFASAVARNPLVRTFEALSTRTRIVACLMGAAMAVLLGYLSIEYGMQPGSAPWLFMAVLALMLMRRAAPMDLQLPRFNYNVLWLAAIVGINVVRGLENVNMNPGVESPAGDGTLVVGNIIMLFGVVAASLQYAWLLHRNQQE